MLSKHWADRAEPLTDTERLDWLARNPGVVKNLKAGVKVEGIDAWQRSLRAAIDVAIQREINA